MLSFLLLPAVTLFRFGSPEIHF